LEPLREGIGDGKNPEVHIRHVDCVEHCSRSRLDNSPSSRFAAFPSPALKMVENGALCPVPMSLAMKTTKKGLRKKKPMDRALVVNIDHSGWQIQTI